MKLLSELQYYPGSVKQKKRKGRGKGSGKGGTSTRGHKGQRSRKSGNAPAGFEGGAMPLVRRIPKFGFTNAPFKTSYSLVKISQLEQADGELNPAYFLKKSWVKRGDKVKILADTKKLSKALKVQAHKFSKQAKAIIEQAGGQANIL